MEAIQPEIQDLDTSVFKITRTTSPRNVPSLGSPEEFSCACCTDHIVTVRWTASFGWEAPEVKPFENISIPPTAPCLNYAVECFEGMKAYRGYDGKLRLFRPDCNGERLATSARRAALPSFPYQELKRLIEKLLQVDGPRWLPRSEPGRNLYIRPNLIASGSQLALQAPREALLYVIAASWPESVNLKQLGGQTPRNGLYLLCSQPDIIRAWPGGVGNFKLGSNYGPAMKGQIDAQAIGFDQVLWLFGPDRQVTEAGASNFFIVWISEQTRRLELVTAPLESTLILPGVTRRSVLELAKSRLSGPVGNLAPVEVVERKFTIAEVEKAWNEGRIIEAFVCGTAFFVTPVACIKNGYVSLKIMETNPNLHRGGYAAQIKSWLRSIQLGEEDHEWAYIIEREIEE